MFKIIVYLLTLCILSISVTSAGSALIYENQVALCDLQNGTHLNKDSACQLLEGFGKQYGFKLSKRHPCNDITKAATLRFISHGKVYGSSMFSTFCDAVAYYVLGKDKYETLTPSTPPPASPKEKEEEENEEEEEGKEKSKENENENEKEENENESKEENENENEG